MDEFPLLFTDGVFSKQKGNQDLPTIRSRITQLGYKILELVGHYLLTADGFTDNIQTKGESKKFQLPTPKVQHDLKLKLGRDKDGEAG